MAYRGGRGNQDEETGGASFRGGSGRGGRGGGYDQRQPSSDYNSRSNDGGSYRGGRSDYDNRDSHESSFRSNRGSSNNFDDRGSGRGGMSNDGAFRGGRGGGQSADYAGNGNRYNNESSFRGGRGGNDGGGGNYRGGRGSNDYDGGNDYQRSNYNPPFRSERGHSNDGGSYRGGRSEYDSRDNHESSFRSNRGSSNNFDDRGGGRGGMSNDGAFRGGRGGSNDGAYRDSRPQYDNGENGNRFNDNSFRGNRSGGNDGGNAPPYRSGRGNFNDGGNDYQRNNYNPSFRSERGYSNDGGSYRGGRSEYESRDNYESSFRSNRGSSNNFDDRRGGMSNDSAFRGGRGGGQSADYGGNRYSNENSFRGGRGGSDGGGGNFRGGRGSNDYDGPSTRGGRGGYNDSGSRPGGYNFGGEMDRPFRPSHIPVERTVDDIYNDDEKRQQTVDFYGSDGQVTVENGPDPLTVVEKWEEAEFNEIIMNNIQRSKYSCPRNFQKYAMPLIMDGLDVKGQAETGSGKSAAFLLPIIHKLHDEFNGKEENDRLCSVAALIIEPTREMAVQLFEQAKKFANQTSVRVNYAYGEYKRHVNKESIYQKGCDILVGTPGRLIDLMTSDDQRAQFLKYDKLKFLVLDEADELLKSTFMPEIQKMVSCPSFPTVENRQTLFFSATFSPQIMQLSNLFCKAKSVVVRNPTTDLNQRVEQEIIQVPYEDRKKYLFEFFEKEKEKNDGVLPKTLLFVETKRDADTLALALQAKGYMTQTVNGDRTQQQREEATRAFREGKLQVVVATNVFARGLDIPDLDHVINVHMPSERDTWVHRNGRTGRLDAGKATTFFDPNYEEDRKMAHVIIEEFGKMGIECPDFVKKVVDNAGCDFSYGLNNEAEQPSNDAADVNEPELNEPEF
ncbi:hypothetical protein M3Y95_00871600 [Aphelenchoides besseyi]|nr:hypothetical protein M3Y95_00871600 [Aphelenchoides besseyi]